MKCAVLAWGSRGLEVGNFPGALASHGAGQSKQNLSRPGSYQNATVPPRPARSGVAGYAQLSAKWTRRETALGHSAGESKWKSKGPPACFLLWTATFCYVQLSFLSASFPPSHPPFLCPSLQLCLDCCILLSTPFLLITFCPLPLLMTFKGLWGGGQVTTIP